MDGLDKEYYARINNMAIEEFYKMSSLGIEFVLEDGKITEVITNG